MCIEDNTLVQAYISGVPIEKKHGYIVNGFQDVFFTLPLSLSPFFDFLLFLFSFYRYPHPASTLYSPIPPLIIVSLIFVPLFPLNQLLSNSALVIIYLSFL